MPVRRIDLTNGTINPTHATSEVTAHYQSAIPKEMPHTTSMKLQSSIAVAKGDRHEMKNSFNHRTGILTTLNDRHATGLDADAELLATATALKGVESCCSPANKNKLKACGSLTTNRAAYNDLLAGENANSKAVSALRGVSAKPIQYHELPYGRECEYVIGEKASIYRADFCNSKTMQKVASEGHAPVSPRLVSVNALANGGSSTNNFSSSRTSSPRNQVQQSNGSARTSPTTATSSQQQYNVFYGAQLMGSEKAERAVDTQARREMAYLRASADRREGEAISLRNQSDTILTPRTLRLQAMANSSIGNGGGYSIPAPPSPRNAPTALSPTAIQSGGASVDPPGTLRSPRSLQPIIFNRSIMDREVPPAVVLAAPPSPRNTKRPAGGTVTDTITGGRGPTTDMYATGPKTFFKQQLSTTNTIPADVSPR